MPGVCCWGRRDGLWRWSSGWGGHGGQGVEPVECLLHEPGPGCVVGQMQGGHAGGGGQVAGDGEQPQPQAFGFPLGGGVVGQREHLHPGSDLTRQRHGRVPDPVLVQVM